MELVNQVYSIPAAEWRYVEVDPNALPVRVEGRFQAISPAARMRLGLARRRGGRVLAPRRSEQLLAQSEVGSSGEISYPLSQPGGYAIVIENLGQSPEAVQLRVALDDQAQVRYLSRPRQLAVILISFGVFFGIVAYSARKLRKATRP
ncbi:MAG: hypothetical protein FJW37_15485 [Acidobacteria bacterium]|nr:hypothetical protein [Acidobacteriota bacterium]